MARIPGKNADFSFDLVQIEDELESIEMLTEVTLPDVTAFADSADTCVEGLPKNRFTLNGAADLAANQGDAKIYGAIGAGPKAYVSDPTGSGPGADAPTYGGNAYVKTYRLTCSVVGAITYSAELQVSGANTRNVTPP